MKFNTKVVLAIIAIVILLFFLIQPLRPKHKTVVVEQPSVGSDPEFVDGSGWGWGWPRWNWYRWGSHHHHHPHNHHPWHVPSLPVTPAVPHVQPDTPIKTPISLPAEPAVATHVQMHVMPPVTTHFMTG